MNRTAIIIIVIVIVILLFVWVSGIFKRIGNSNNTFTPTSPDGPSGPSDIRYDYFVNGNDSHDIEVFNRGRECVLSLLYKNSSNPMANAVLSVLGRGDGTSGPCSGFNCKLVGAIDSLSQAQRSALIQFVTNLNAYNIRQELPTWKVYSNLSAGNKNMCSVILEQAVKSVLPQFYEATQGRG